MLYYKLLKIHKLLTLFLFNLAKMNHFKFKFTDFSEKQFMIHKTNCTRKKNPQTFDISFVNDI